MNLDPDYPSNSNNFLFASSNSCCKLYNCDFSLSISSSLYRSWAFKRSISFLYSPCFISQSLCLLSHSLNWVSNYLLESPDCRSRYSCSSWSLFRSLSNWAYLLSQSEIFLFASSNLVCQSRISVSYFLL